MCRRPAILTFILVLPQLARLEIGDIGIQRCQVIAHIHNQRPSSGFRSTSHQTFIIEFNDETVFHGLEPKQSCMRATSKCRTNVGHEVNIVAQGLNSIEACDQRKWNITIFGHLLPKEDVCLKILCTEIVFTREKRKRLVDEQSMPMQRYT